MVSLNRARRLRGATLVAAFACAAVAQSVDAGKQLAEGQQLRAQGRYADAQKVLAALRREMERTQPPGPFLATVLDNQAMAEMNLGNYLEAESLLTRSLGMWRKAGAADAGATAAEGHLAELYLAERRAADAEPLLRETIATLESAALPDRVAMAVNLTDMAVVYASQKRLREAERQLQRALGLLEAELGKDHPMLASTLIPLTAVLIAEHRYAAAVEPAERAWNLLRKASPKTADPDLASALDALGVVYSRTGRLQEAEACARQAIQMAETIYGPEHPHTAWYLANYATILKQVNRKSEAKALQERADAILAQSARNNPTQYTVTVNALR